MTGCVFGWSRGLTRANVTLKMFNRHLTRSALWLAVVGGAFCAVSVWACSVPVFRYALEKWPADPYQAIVFHRGALSGAQQEMVRELAREGMAGRLHANLTAQTIDLDQNANPDVLQFWQQLGAESAPWLVVKYPSPTRLAGRVFSGPLDRAAIAQVLESPARKEIVQRLASGQSAVWVLLEVGDPKQDDAAAELIQTRLKYLAGVLKLPKIEAQDVASGLISVPEHALKLEFSLLRLSRADHAEQAFVKMLLGTEADLEEMKEPMVFPIFGRARALYALIGKGINHETIDEAASFLIGQCSCQVKEQNPGVDLLFAADWNTLLKAGVAAAPAQAELDKAVEPAPETATISGGDNPESAVPSPGSFGASAPLTRPILVVSAVVALVAAILIFARRK